MRRGKRGGIGLFIYAVLYLAFLYLPVMFLPLFSFNNSMFISFPLSGFTTHWYAQMWADSEVQRALGNSLKVGAAAAIVATMLGLPAAKALTRYPVRGKSALIGFVNLPLFIPEIVLGISLLILLNAAAIPLSLATVVIGHITVCVPFAITVLMSRMEGFDKSLGGSLARPRRERLDDVLARDLPAGAARHRLGAALDLHGVVRRFPHRLFPRRHAGDAADLHLGAAALPLQASHRPGARRADPARVLRPGGAGGMDPKPRQRGRTVVGA